MGEALEKELTIRGQSAAVVTQTSQNPDLRYLSQSNHGKGKVVHTIFISTSSCLPPA